MQQQSVPCQQGRFGVEKEARALAPEDLWHARCAPRRLSPCEVEDSLGGRTSQLCAATTMSLVQTDEHDRRSLKESRSVDSTNTSCPSAESLSSAPDLRWLDAVLPHAPPRPSLRDYPRPISGGSTLPENAIGDSFCVAPGGGLAESCSSEHSIHSGGRMPHPRAPPAWLSPADESTSPAVLHAPPLAFASTRSREKQHYCPPASLAGGIGALRTRPAAGRDPPADEEWGWFDDDDMVQ